MSDQPICEERNRHGRPGARSSQSESLKSGPRFGLLIALAVTALLLAACAAGVNPEVGTAAEGGDVAGFWLGLWHGIIAPITFFISLFTENVNIYEVHNNGNWYDFGFVLGAGILFGGGMFGGRR